MKKLKELIQEKMNASQYEQGGLKVKVTEANEIIMQFRILNGTFQIKDKSIASWSRIEFSGNSAKFIHSKIMNNKSLQSKIQTVIKTELKNRMAIVIR